MPAHHEARVDRRAAPLVDQDVRPLLGEEHRARLRLRAERDLVRHRRGRQEERRLVAEQLGHAALQLVDGRILAVLLVADLGGAIAASIAGVGFVSVSERRSITPSDAQHEPLPWPPWI